MRHFHDTAIVDENLKSINGKQKNQFMIEADGTLRCLFIPPMYFGLDDEAEGFTFSEYGFYIHLLNLD